MKILFVIGSCLKVNTSANLCHLAYIRGCKELGCYIDVVSMGDRGCSIDSSIELPQIDHWYMYEPPTYNNATTSGKSSVKENVSFFNKVKKLVKKIILPFYGIYGRTASIWVRKASNFKTNVEYDYLISLATPYVSHQLAGLLLKRGNVKCKTWLQIWEDPWAADLYNLKSSDRIKKEEKRLISIADKVLYVSPLTLKYQKEMYPEFASKMSWMTLPYYYKNADTLETIENQFGYFGDYYSFSRNLLPFYEAAVKENINAFIFGNSDLNLKTTKNVIVKPRVGLSELTIVEKRTNILVFLCNLKGGQIPGKLYQYSATEKQILFILDGIDEEIEVLQSYFSRFNRYIFCKNTVEDICIAINKIRNGINDVDNKVVDEFSPYNTMKSILNL